MVIFYQFCQDKETQTFTFSGTKSHVSPQKASEEIVPNEPDSYRPPAELYPYLTTVGEIYEGEQNGFNHRSEHESLHDCDYRTILSVTV